jgi:hypothetical protein
MAESQGMCHVHLTNASSARAAVAPAITQCWRGWGRCSPWAPATWSASGWGATLCETFETRDACGDHYLFGRVRELAKPPNPLLALEGDPFDMRACAVALTDLGDAVLSGKTNALDLRPLDMWIGGVHLDADHVWCRDDSGRVQRR